MFRDCIRTIIEEAGTDVFSDPERFKAYVGDLCQEYPQEKDFLINVCDEEYIKLFYVLDKTEDVRINNSKLAANILIEKKMIAEKWANYISSEIMEGVVLYNKNHTLHAEEKKCSKEPASKDEIQTVLEENVKTLKALQEILDEQYKTDNKEAANLIEKKDKEEKNIYRLKSDIDQLSNRKESLEKEKTETDPFFHWMKTVELDESINGIRNTLIKQNKLLQSAYKKYEDYQYQLKNILDAANSNSDHIDALVKCIDMIKEKNEEMKGQLQAE